MGARGGGHYLDGDIEPGGGVLQVPNLAAHQPAVTDLTVTVQVAEVTLATKNGDQIALASDQIAL